MIIKVKREQAFDKLFLDEGVDEDCIWASCNLHNLHKSKEMFDQ
jgi:hypothetical protein